MRISVDRGGFIIIIVVTFLAILIIAASVIVNIGCSEIAQTSAYNNMAGAYYAAMAGAEMMYAKLKSQEGDTVAWPQSASGNVQTRASGGTNMGTYTTSANTVTSAIFGIVSEGIYKGKSAKVTVKYGFDSPFTNGYPIGCRGSMILAGSKFGPLRSWVRAEGPIASGSTVSTNNFVKISGDVLENQPFSTPSFWLGATYDTNNNGSYVTDTNEDGAVNTADITEGQEDTFAADDVNGDGIINDRDAFVYYYTVYLDDPNNNPLGQDLGIAPGETNHYVGSQTFDPWSVPEGTPIIFVDGDVEILFSDTAWWGQNVNHTIVATGDITIVQPTNGEGDTLALISYGDVVTGGVRAFGGVRGEFVVYAHNDFNAYYGGRSDGTIFANNNVTVDTVFAIPGLLNRDLNKGTTDWADEANWPLGLPPNFSRISLSFRIKNESTEYVPVWQVD